MRAAPDVFDVPALPMGGNRLQRIFLFQQKWLIYSCEKLNLKTEKESRDHLRRWVRGSLCPLLAGGRHYRRCFNEAVTLWMNQRGIALLCHSLFAAFNHLPEVPDHHADPDPGPPAVCCAAVSHCRGIAQAGKQIRGRETGFSDERLCLQRDLLGVQHLLNSSEASLHQLTALLDCRGLNKVCLFRVVLVSEPQNWVSRREVKLGGEKATVPRLMCCIMSSLLPGLSAARLFMNNAGLVGPWQHISACAVSCA